jgi:hypothetical protein
MEGTLKKLIFVLCIVAIIAVFYSQLFNMLRQPKPPAYGKYHESRRTVMATRSSQPPHQKPKSPSKKEASPGGSAIAAADSNVVAPTGGGSTAWPWGINKPAPAPQQPRPANIYPIPKRIDLGHIEGKGIGYDRGYTDLSIVFAPEYRVGHYLSLISLRGVVFDDGKFAANAAYIGRYLPSAFCEVFGFNLSYDFREGRHGNFNQVSGGFEVINRRWDLHLNGSAPVGTRTHTKTCVFDDFIGPFREVCHQNEAAQYFVDGSLGYYMVNGKNFQLYAGAGSYYLWGHFHKSGVGGKAVLRPQFGDVLSVELSVSHDRIFETIYQVNAVLTLPLYKFSSRLKHKKGSCGTNNRQIYQPVSRDIVLVRRTCSHNNFGSSF